MKKAVLFLVLFFVLAGLAGALCPFKKFLGQASCLDNIDLHYIDFMHKSHQDIAENLAAILDVLPAVFSQKLSIDSQSVGLAWEEKMKLIKEGYEYTTANGAKLTIWVDADGQPYTVTYLLKRWGTSTGWSQEKVKANIQNILNRLGIAMSGAEDFSLNKSAAGRNAHWYDVAVKQKFRDTSLCYPGIYAEIEGDTGEINFLKIYRWYTDLDKITVVLSDEKLRDIAISCSSKEVISGAGKVTVGGLYLIEDKLCKRVGGAVIDEWGSTLYLFIDIQSGKVVNEERLWKDSTPFFPLTFSGTSSGSHRLGRPLGRVVNYNHLF